MVSCRKARATSPRSPLAKAKTSRPHRYTRTTQYTTRRSRAYTAVTSQGCRPSRHSTTQTTSWLLLVAGDSRGLGRRNSNVTALLIYWQAMLSTLCDAHACRGPAREWPRCITARTRHGYSRSRQQSHRIRLGVLSATTNTRLHPQSDAPYLLLYEYPCLSTAIFVLGTGAETRDPRAHFRPTARIRTT